MHPLLRSSLALTAVIACADAGASVRRTCITALEAQPRPAASVAAAPKKACPVAIAHMQRAPLPRAGVAAVGVRA